MRKVVIPLVLIAIVAFIGFYFASPFIAFRHLEAVAKAGDRDGLEDAVDFPALRQDFKAQLDGALVASVGSDQSLRGNPLAAIGLLLGPAVIDRLVDAYVTPEAIAKMLTEARPPLPGHHPPEEKDKPRVTFRSGYDGIDRFEVTAREDREPNRPLVFVMTRHGMFDWKLVRIELPLNAPEN